MSSVAESGFAQSDLARPCVGSAGAGIAGAGVTHASSSGGAVAGGVVDGGMAGDDYLRQKKQRKPMQYVTTSGVLRYHFSRGSGWAPPAPRFGRPPAPATQSVCLSRFSQPTPYMESDAMERPQIT